MKHLGCFVLINRIASSLSNLVCFIIYATTTVTDRCFPHLQNTNTPFELFRYLNISLINFGSKRQKDAEPWDSSDVRVMEQNLIEFNMMHRKVMSDLAKELKDSCGSRICDTSTVRRIIERYK